MSKRPHAERTIRADLRPFLSKFTALVGEVTYASNGLHQAFFLLFKFIFEDEQEEMVEEIWHSLRSDDIQRTVLKAAARHSADLGPRRRGALIWAIDRAGKLAEFRNDAIHTLFEYQGDNKGSFTIYPSDWSATPRRVEKLNRVGYEKLFKLLIGDLYALTAYVGYIADTFIETPSWTPEPLPSRPLLQSIQLVEKSPPKTNSRQQRSPKQKRQRKSSLKKY